MDDFKSVSFSFHCGQPEERLRKVDFVLFCIVWRFISADGPDHD